MSAEGTKQLSDDGLLEWSGKEWNRVPEVAAMCPRCGDLVQANTGKRSFKCSAGHEHDFVQCLYCESVMLRPREHRDYATRCIFCGATTKVPKAVPAWEWASDESTRGRWPPGHGDSGRRRLDRMRLLSASGSALRAQELYTLDFGDSTLRVTSLQTAGQIDEVDFADIRLFEVEVGRQRKDHREMMRDFLGGGFIGAAVAAGTREALTTSVLRIGTPTTEYAFESERHVPGALRQLLEPVGHRLTGLQRITPAAPPTHPPTPPASLADELFKLAQLRDCGVLSAEEFETAKARLLATQ